MAVVYGRLLIEDQYLYYTEGEDGHHWEIVYGLRVIKYNLDTQEVVAEKVFDKGEIQLSSGYPPCVAATENYLYLAGMNRETDEQQSTLLCLAKNDLSYIGEIRAGLTSPLVSGGIVDKNFSRVTAIRDDLVFVWDIDTGSDLTFMKIGDITALPKYPLSTDLANESLPTGTGNASNYLAMTTANNGKLYVATSEDDPENSNAVLFFIHKIDPETMDTEKTEEVPLLKNTETETHYPSTHLALHYEEHPNLLFLAVPLVGLVAIDPDSLATVFPEGGEWEGGLLRELYPNDSSNDQPGYFGKPGATDKGGNVYYTTDEEIFKFSRKTLCLEERKPHPFYERPEIVVRKS